MAALERIAGPLDFQHHFGVSDRTLERLTAYADLLQHWQKRINLVGGSTLGTLWQRHIADAAQLVACGAGYGRTWIDLGSGAGLPGLVIAILLEGEDGAHVHLVESNGKKSAFLREAVRLTAAPASVHAVRIESLDAARLVPEPRIVTARALAPLVRLLDLARPWLERGAVGLFLKGQDVDDELTEAAKYWRIVQRSQPSRSDPRGCILLVEEARRVDR